MFNITDKSSVLELDIEIFNNTIIENLYERPPSKDEFKNLNLC